MAKDDEEEKGVSSDAGKTPEMIQKELDERKKQQEEEQSIRAAAKLRKGDYVVQVHVIEARDLKARDFGDTSDPVVVVKCGTQKRATKIHKKCFSAVFDEVIVFEFKDLEPAEVEQMKVSLQVFDANVMLRDVLIGGYEFDLSTIYSQKYHEFYRRWVALSDTSDDFEGVQGYLRASLCVLGPDDEQHTHTAAEEQDDDGSNMLSVLLPPQIEAVTKMLRVSVYELQDLPRMDEDILGGWCDGYGRIDFAGVVAKTKWMTGKSITINQVLCIPVMEPILSSNIKFSCYDYDATSSDDRIASCLFDYNEVKAHRFEARWVQLYGAPEDEQKGVASKMNRGIIPGSFYRGRALVGMEVVDVRDPKLTVDDTSLSPAFKPSMSKFCIQCDVYEGSEILETKECWIEVSVQRLTLSSSRKPSKEGIVDFYEQLSLPSGDGDLLVELPDDLLQCPDIFVYLCTKKGRVSFLRVPFAECVQQGWAVPPTWRNFSVDKALDKLPAGEFAGALLFSLRAGLASTCPSSVLPQSRPNAQSIVSSRPSTPVTPSLEKNSSLIVASSVVPPDPVKVLGKLTITVKEGKNFPGIDSGSCDPFVKLIVAENQEVKTGVMKGSLNPEFNESFVFENFLLDESNTTKIRCKVYDYNVFKNNKFADLMIDIRSALPDDFEPGKDFVQSYELMISDEYPKARLTLRFKMEMYEWSKQPKAGAAKKPVGLQSLSAALFSKGSASSSDYSASGRDSKASKNLTRPNRKQYQLRAHIFQARNLPAVDSNGLADPYLVISCAGKRLKTEIVKETVNPAYYKTLTANVSLPHPNELAADIMCYAWDYDLAQKDDTLGHFRVSVMEARDNGRTPESFSSLKPRWYKLKDNNYNSVDGEVLACFQLLSVSDAVAPVPDLRPPTKLYSLEVLTLGLRDLSATFRINKSEVEFEVPQLDNHTRKFTSNASCLPSNVNPNFLTVLKMPIDLPIDPMFAPVIGMKVNDNLLGGLITRNIGTCALPLAPFIVDKDGDGNIDTDETVEILDEVAIEKELAVQSEARKVALEKEAKQKQVAAENQNREKEEERKKKEEEERKKKEEEERKKQASKAAPSKPQARSSSNPDDLPEVGLTPSDPLLGESKPSYSEDSEAKNKEDMEAERQRLTKEKEEKEAKEKDKEEDLGENMDEVIKVNINEKIPDEPEEVPAYLKDRLRIDDELEDYLEIGPTKRKNAPFQVISVYTGNKNAIFESQKFRRVGYWKGLIRLQSSDQKESMSSQVKEMLQPKSVFVRVYILQGHRLNPKDDNGKSDPYLIVNCGSQSVSTRDRYVPETLDPDFFESFEFPCTLPGDSRLEIKVLDYDGFNDDEIGSTTIDLEDRWFAKSWRKMLIKPLEIRTLHSTTSTSAQGKLSVWIDIVTPEEAKKSPLLNIKPPAPEMYELRVIMWNCHDVVIKDEITEANDLYITGKLEVKDAVMQSTDTHLRARKGKASWNWRMKFPIALPCKSFPRFRMQLWDLDFFSPDDSICEISFSLKGLCKKTQKTQKRVRLVQGNSFSNDEKLEFAELRHPEFPGTQGAVTCSFEMMPLTLASVFPAGFGQDAPNTNPVLPPPEGRVNWSLLHPFDMLFAILGDNICKKLLLIVLIGCLISAIYFMAPV